MLLAYAVLAVCVASNAVSSAAASPLDKKVHYDLNDAANLFKKHVKQYEKKYGVYEYNLRFKIFKESLIRINKLNSQSSHAVFKVNFFSDLTLEEKQIYHFGFISSTNDSITPVFPPWFKAPAKLDWRDRGVVAPIKNQGSCGSCYIFSAIGNIEGQYALKHQECLSFSEEQVLDCLPYTCDGGWPHDVMQSLSQDQNACMLERDYPYEGVKDQCKEKSSQGAKVLSGEEISIGDENVLKDTLAQKGPLSVTLDVPTSLFDYHGGIFDLPCDPKGLHAVLLIGYGEENGTPFWILKNSWAKSWGEQGYFRLVRGKRQCNMGVKYTASSTVA